MIELKNSFRSGLDLDSSYYRVKKEGYADALNITRDAIAGSSDEVISNIVGNRIFNYNLPTGTNKRIGSYANVLRNTVIAFVWNSFDQHSIIEYNLTTRVATRIFQSLLDSDTDILGFTQNGKITGINIYNRDEGDLLFFLDSLGRPTYMDIELFKAQTYNPVTRDIIDVCLLPPLSPVICNYGNDTTRAVNNFNKKITRYRYRWIYDDFGKSAYSTFSAVPLPINILDPVYTNVQTNNNVINLTLNSGGKNVKAVELCVSISEGSAQFERFKRIKVIDKATEGIADDTDFTVSFYNDSTYPFISDAESDLPYDFVPDNALAQDFPMGNVDAYGGVTEGLSTSLSPNVVITINTVAAGNGGTVGNLNAIETTVLDNSLVQIFNIAFSGIPATGTVISIRVQQVSGGAIFTAATYTTVAGDTAASVATAISASFNSMGQVSSATVTGGTSVTVTANAILAPKRIFYDITITAPSVSTSTNSVATWKWSTERNVGIVYFTKKGKTNGVLYNAKITFPAYAENGSQIPLLPYINIKIYHVPPDWAYSYQIVFTKEPTDYLFIECVDVNTTETNYIYFDITNLGLNQRKNPTTAEVISWTFQEGDRMRLIRRMADGNVFGATYDTAIEGIVSSPTINNVVQTDKTFIKIKNQSPFSTQNYASKFFVIEIFRPGVQPPSGTNATYYECGVQFPILNPTTATRVHGGQVTNQSTDYVTPAEMNLYNGDSYFRNRQMVLGETGIGNFNVQDRNFVDFFISSVSSIDGRAWTIEENARAATYGATIRHSEAYQPNTNINGLHRFFPNNLLDCNYAYGSIRGMVSRDKLMKVFQENKIGRVPLFSQINRESNGNTVQVVTDKLLNPIEYYVGNWGIGTAASSLVSFNYADYFVDNVRGAVIRSSYDGLDVLSLLYSVNSWAVSEIPLRTGSYHIYGGYDQKLNNYIIALEASATTAAQTLTFTEGEKEEQPPSFESFISLFTEGMTTCGTTLCAWKDGSMWTHDSSTYNNFFGIQYDSYIKFVFNENTPISKTFLSIDQRASAKWDCPEIITQVNTYGSTPQQSNLVANEFQLLEDKFAASIKRDVNSIGGKINGNSLKGNWCTVKFRKQNASELVTLNMVGMVTNYSPMLAK